MCGVCREGTIIGTLILRKSLKFVYLYVTQIVDALISAYIFRLLKFDT